MIEKYLSDIKDGEPLEAPDYPATCDQCGEVGTNATIEEHICQAQPEQALSDRTTPLQRLIKAAEFLVAMNACNYDRDTMRSEGGFLKLEQAVTVAKEYADNYASLVAALEQFISIYPPNARRHPDVGIAIQNAERVLSGVRE